MAKKAKSFFTLREKATKLRSFGYKVQYGKKGKTGAKYKGDVTKKWKLVSKYVEGAKQKFDFHPAKKEFLSELRAGLGKEPVTPGGFFLKRVKGSRVKPRLVRKTENSFEFTATGPKGGRVIERIYRINPELLMEDPPKAILKMGRKNQKVILMVNGFDSVSGFEYSLEQLAYYLALSILPKFLDPNIGEDEGEPDENLHGLSEQKYKRRLQEFSDIFHIKVITYLGAKKRASKKSKPRKQKRASKKSKPRKQKRSKVRR